MLVMIAAGIDIGHQSVNVVLLKDKAMLGQGTFVLAGAVETAATAAFEAALKEHGLELSRINRIFATGVGREKVPFAHGHRTEMLCQVKGVHSLFPEARTVIDLGAEGSRILRCDDQGNLTNFLLNDKCASGAGIFLETVAGMVQLPISEIGPASLRSTQKLTLTSTCAVFAESEIVAEIHRGSAKEDILAAVHESIAAKVIAGSQRIGVESALVLTGGVALNQGLVETFRRQMGMEVKVPPLPEITGALGAAILAESSLGSA
ncbi:MAG TPA: acyl-CoA dehydratase activase [Thermodesulfobacteriota bacterium]|nr:acyl-CoA dehydratase activase [Thermodesulfobacteriota bacterium]